jgi:phage tail sheath protein FI
MAEDFAVSELVIPGTYVRVRAEALISAGGISSGNIGIVGTASQGDGATHVLSDFESAKAIFGNYDAFSAGTLNLTRGLELLYQNGARTVFARALPTAGNPGQTEFAAAFTELLKEDVNILVAPQLSTDTAKALFGTLVDGAEGNGKDLIAVIGSDKTTAADIKAQVAGNDRIIFTAPGIEAFDAIAKANVTLPGNYSAAAVAGLISSLTAQTSPTNKVLPGVVKLANKFTYGEMVDLVKSRICLLEERQGVRVVRGVTTDNGAFTQITTRRITDFAKAGIRQVSNPFIGRLNNQRVRKALQGAIDGFLTTMVQDEALITYELEVTASRQDEIAGRCLVNVTLQPTFSIDFIAVTMVLQ